MRYVKMVVPYVHSMWPGVCLLYMRRYLGRRHGNRIAALRDIIVQHDGHAGQRFGARNE